MACLNYDALLLVKFFLFLFLPCFGLELSGSYRLSIEIYLINLFLGLLDSVAVDHHY